jgi:hypothetical protein
LWSHLWLGAIWLGLLAIVVVLAAGVVRAVVDRRHDHRGATRIS